MEWYVWVALGIFAVPAWFIVGALTERACRSIFDPGVIIFDEWTEELAAFTWSGPIGLLLYSILCIIAVLVIIVKLCWRFVQWIRGINSKKE